MPDRTAELQGIIDTAIAQGTEAIIPPGEWSVSALTLRGTMGLVLRGHGPHRSHLLPNTDDVRVIDCAHAAAAVLRDFSIGYHLQTAVPSTALMLAALPNPTQNGIDRIRLENLFVTGRYRVSALYVYGVASWTLAASRFWNFYQPHPVAAVFTSRDRYGLIGDPEIRFVSDTTCLGCEFHSGHNETPIEAGQPAVVLDLASGMRFYGGNIASPTGPIVWLNDCHHILFDAVGFYSDYGPTPTPVLSLAGTSDPVTIERRHS